MLRVLCYNSEEISRECLIASTIRQLELLTKKVSPFPYPKLEISIFMFILIDIIKSQCHGDFVVSVLRTVTAKVEHENYDSKNF